MVKVGGHLELFTAELWTFWTFRHEDMSFDIFKTHASRQFHDADCNLFDHHVGKIFGLPKILRMILLHRDLIVI